MGHYFHKGRRRVTQWQHSRGPVEETVVGPHCFLFQERHPEPFNKTVRGKSRRAEKRFKTQRRIDDGSVI